MFMINIGNLKKTKISYIFKKASLSIVYHASRKHESRI